MKNILVTGAGGFIGGHLVKRLLDLGYTVTCVDRKPYENWFQIFNESKNIQADLKILDNCMEVVQSHDTVFNLACNMGGIGFIESYKAECMLSVLINTHLLIAAKKFDVKNFFFSSTACVYNTNLQNTPNVDSLKEDDAYPALPEDGYGWEKLFSERMCNHFHEDYSMNIKVARFHNIYGPFGTFDGGREKSPAALARKIAFAKKKSLKSIEVWGNGEQTRSYLYISDCIDAILLLMNSSYHRPINIGSEERVSINEMIKKLETISKYKVNLDYNLNKPIGVKGRSSNNTIINTILNWKPKISLEIGLKLTYDWIENITHNIDIHEKEYLKFSNPGI